MKGRTSATNIGAASLIKGLYRFWKPFPKIQSFLIERRLYLKQKNDLKLLIAGSVDILCIAESKVEESF